MKNNHVVKEEVRTQLAAVILAAGLGKRIASLGDKPFLIYENKTFFENCLEKIAQTGVRCIYAVTNPKFMARLNNLSGGRSMVLLNDEPEEGMMSSIKIVLAHVGGDVKSILLSQVDYPHVHTSTYISLAAASRNFSGSIIKPTYAGQNGHPVIIPRTLFNTINKAEKNVTLRDIFYHNRKSVVTIPVDDPGILININTPEAYRSHCLTKKTPYPFNK